MPEIPGPEFLDDDTVPYDVGEIVRLLKATADFDWERFLTERISRPLDALPLDLVGRLGYRLQYAPTPPDHRRRTHSRGGISAQHSLGLTFSADGQIIDIVPGMAGDKARLAPGMKVMGINGRLFSARRLQDALADSVALRKIELLLLEGDRFRTIRPRLRRRSQVPRACPGRIEARPAGPDLAADRGQARARRRVRSLPKGYVAYRAAEPITIDGKTR